MSIDDVLFNVLFTNLISIGAAENLKLEAQSSEAPEKNVRMPPILCCAPSTSGAQRGHNIKIGNTETVKIT